MDDLPGYRKEPYVQDFLPTPVRRVPCVKTRPTFWDILGTCRARLGLNRNRYVVHPGLYAVGQPAADSPVLVTANYKLTFDAVRFCLAGRAAWLLVVDTRGINVWCAGGKGTLNAQAIAEQVRANGLEHIVTHRRLIVPQLGANGVRVRELHRLCGFRAEFGPIQARDIGQYLDHGPDERMRTVRFDLSERAALIPVEVVLSWKIVLGALLVTGLLSVAGVPVSGAAIAQRWLVGFVATLLGLLAGAAFFPLVLPWMPTRFFSAGGAICGGVCAGALPLLFPAAPWPTLLGATCWTATLASWMSLNFTGSTPYTSPSGVEKEMRMVIPVLAAAVLGSIILFVWGNFLGGVS